jgi:manganese-dependent inorganic pyrophosphatase
MKETIRMSTVLVFGHRNPDTDSICSAIAYAHLLNKTGIPAEAVRLGHINDETAYALRTFAWTEPRLVERVAAETDVVALVDHNEWQQSAEDIGHVRISRVIDHHRVHNFQTETPLYYRAEPLGCTATILYKLYREYDVPIEPKMAGLMVSAIVSDTLLLRSPTCTDEDRTIAAQLAEIADVDIEQYGMEMLRAGTDVGQKTAEQLLDMDCKSFSIDAMQVRIAQVNVISPLDVLDQREDIVLCMEQRIASERLDLFLFLITDIVHQDSIALAYGPHAQLVERAFGVLLHDHEAKLPGIVSRKSQVIPPLTHAARQM